MLEIYAIIDYITIGISGDSLKKTWNQQLIIVITGDSFKKTWN